MKKILSFFLAALLLTSCSSMKTTPTTSTTTSELKTEDTTIGDGDTSETGDTVEVNYTGMLEDGTVFDSSKKHNQTFTFTLGAGQVIQGWDEGVPGMKVGGERTLTIPSDMAYGKQGIPGVIPGGATLIFDVELVSIK